MYKLPSTSSDKTSETKHCGEEAINRFTVIEKVVAPVIYQFFLEKAISLGFGRQTIPTFELSEAGFSSWIKAMSLLKGLGEL